MKKYTYSDFCYAVKLYEKDDLKKALPIIEGFLGELKRTKQESPYVYYMYAVCKDLAGSCFDALVAVNRALSLDPFVPSFHISKGIIMKNVMNELRALIATGKTAQVKEVYGIMLELGDITPLVQELMMEVAYQEDDDEFRDYLKENILKANPNYKFNTAA